MWYVRNNEWRVISARHVRTNEWHAVSARHVVVKVTSRRARSCSETRVYNGLRGRGRNTPLHLSLALTGYLQICTLKVYVPYPSVVFGREVLGEVIGKVFGSLLLVQVELILIYAAAHPVEFHVKGFGAFPAHVADEDALGGRAVGLDQGWRLRVDHFDEGCADGNILLAVEENRSSFGFHGGSHDGADGLTFGEYRTNRGWSGADVV